MKKLPLPSLIQNPPPLKAITNLKGLKREEKKKKEKKVLRSGFCTLLQQS